MKKLTVLLRVYMLPILATGQISSSLDARFQTILDSVSARYNIKGASAAVLIPGAGVWKGVYGLSAANQSMTRGMVLGIGSNTKTFIATTLLKLQEQQRIDLDDTIGTWFSTHPNINGQITIRQLLNHTSGLYNYTDNAALNSAIAGDYTAIWQPAQLLPYIDAPAFVAGTDWAYSNTNYLLAGLIITEVTGQSLVRILEQEIFLPHQLNHTYLFPEQSLNDTMTHIWSKYFVKPYLEDIVTLYGYSQNAVFSMAWAAGGIVSTAEDNVQFWHQLMSGQVISPSSLNEMRDFEYLSTNRGYGLGLFRTRNYHGRVVYGHGGTNLGFINESVVDSASGICISLLTNQDSVSNSILFSQVLPAFLNASLQATSVEQINGAQFTFLIFPNPASSFVDIKTGDRDLYKAEVINLYGQAVIQPHYIKSAGRMYLGDLSPGVYIVCLSDLKGRVIGSERLVVI